MAAGAKHASGGSTHVARLAQLASPALPALHLLHTPATPPLHPSGGVRRVCLGEGPCTLPQVCSRLEGQQCALPGHGRQVGGCGAMASQSMQPQPGARAVAWGSLDFIASECVHIEQQVLLCCALRCCALRCCAQRCCALRCMCVAHGPSLHCAAPRNAQHAPLFFDEPVSRAACPTSSSPISAVSHSRSPSQRPSLLLVPLLQDHRALRGH